MTWGSFDLLGHSLYVKMLNSVLPDIAGFDLRLFTFEGLLI